MNYIDISFYQQKEYKRILAIIAGSCSTFKIVDSYHYLDIKDLGLEESLIEVKRSNEWAGTETKGRKAIIYTFNLSPESIKFFRKKDSFFEDKGNYFSNTGLDGQYDYSFFEKDSDDCLVYLTVHEGQIFMREDIYDKHFRQVAGECDE